MKSFRIILIVGLFVLSVFSQEVFAASYTITSYPTRPGWNGGPFVINGSEVTYCIEVSETISLGSSYYGSIDAYARQGGNLSSANGGGPPSVPGTPNKDYLDYWTQWLVANYLTQSLANQNRMQDFQNAIWFIEGEISSLPARLGDTNYYSLAQSSGQNSNIPGINVLNLYDDSGLTRDRQSLITVPEPGILILLGIAMSAIGAASWRLRKL